MRSIGWTYKRLNVKIQARDLLHNPANLILSVLGIVSIVTVAFLFGYSARMPAWGADVVPAILEKRSGLALLLLSYCVFFGVVTFILTLIALFYPTQVQELERLRALPITESALFGFKCGDILHSMTPLVFLVVLAAGAGLNLGGQAGLGFVAILLVLSVLLVYVVGWMMIALVLAVVTLLPRALLGRGALLGAIVILGASGIVSARALDRRHVLDVLAGVGPTAWTADLVLSARAGNWGKAATSGALVAAVAVALRTLAFLAYRSLYLRRLTPLLEKVWPHQDAGVIARAAAGRGEGFTEALLRPLVWASPATRAIARKDLLWIARDPIVGYAAYAAVALVLLGVGLAAWEARRGELEEGVAYPIWGVVLLVVSGHLLNLNLSAFGREERCLEGLRGTPVTPRNLLAAKFHVALVLSLPVAALAVGMVALATRGEDGTAGTVRAALVVAVLGAAAFSWISVTLGAIFPKYDSKNQFRAVTLVGVGVHVSLLGLLVASAIGAVAAVKAYGAAFVFVPATVALLWIGVLALLGREARRALHAMLGTRMR
ncbi:MAG: hypothetical protein AAB434_03980 [Planctomycetota bacterium]